MKQRAFFDLSKGYRFEGVEVAVKRVGNGVLLMPLNQPWAVLEAGLAAFEPHFTLERNQPKAQIRTEISP
jgi:antitoxin VapB